jgi:hypothetical protein
MANEPNAFLTDERAAVLAGNYEGNEAVERTHKSRIRQRARSALDELILVAQSDEIENADVFEPDKVGTLIHWLLRDPSQLEAEGLLEGFTEDQKEYRTKVHSEVAQEIMKIDHPEKGRFDD